MNKSDFQKKVSELEKMVSEGRFSEATELADIINLSLIDRPATLLAISKAYEKCRRYDDAADVLEHAYEIVPRSRIVLFHLCAIMIKGRHFKDAEDYLKEFVEIAPNDTERFVLAYRLASARKKPVSERIEILTQLKDEEPNDRWMYELAMLYVGQNRMEEAEAVLEEVCLWFDSGEFVRMSKKLLAEIRDEEYVEEEDDMTETEEEQEEKPVIKKMGAPITLSDEPDKADETEPESVENEDSDREKNEKKAKEAEEIKAREDELMQIARQEKLRLQEEHSNEMKRLQMEEAKAALDEAREDENYRIGMEKEAERLLNQDVTSVHQDDEDEHIIFKVTGPQIDRVIETEEIPGNEIPFDSFYAQDEKKDEDLALESTSENNSSVYSAEPVTEYREEAVEEETETDPVPEDTSQTEESESDELSEASDDITLRFNAFTEQKKAEKPEKNITENDFCGLPFEPEISDKICHMMVFGDTESLRLSCAKDKIREIIKITKYCPTKVLKLTAEKIGNASIINSLDRFLGNVVIIEHASLLSDKQLKEFAKALEPDDRSILVVFADELKNINGMLERVPELVSALTAVFEGKEYTPKDLVGFATDFLLSKNARPERDAEKEITAYARFLLLKRTDSYRKYMIRFAEKALEECEKGDHIGRSNAKKDGDDYIRISARHFKRAKN